MRRASRRVIAVLTLLGILVVQGPVAAHACSGLFAPATGTMPALAMGAAMPDCAGMHDVDDSADAALCVQHCGQGHDANTTLGTADVPAPALHLYLTIEPAPMQVTASTLAATRPAARSTSPPPLLLSQRLRI
jgi:hypothetical protein